MKLVVKVCSIQFTLCMNPEMNPKGIGSFPGQTDNVAMST